MRKVIVALVAVSMLGVAADAPAGHAKNCGLVTKGTRDYRVRANAVTCDFARTWSKRFLRRSSRPSGWSCSRPSGKITFYCRRGSKYYYAEPA